MSLCRPTALVFSFFTLFLFARCRRRGPFKRKKEEERFPGRQRCGPLKQRHVQIPGVTGVDRKNLTGSNGLNESIVQVPLAAELHLGD